MRSILQMMVVSAIIGAGYANMDVVKSTLGVVEQVQIDTTGKIEIKNIGRSILMYYISNDEVPKPEEFSEWLRENMITVQEGTGRDPAEDVWGTPFKLVIKRKKGVKITSAGPDTLFDTEDDITHFQTLEQYGF